MNCENFCGSASRRLILPAILVFLLSIPSAAGAQVIPEASIGLTFGLPSGEFKNEVSAVGIGLTFTGGVQLPRSPIFLGGDLGFLIYGYDSRREPFSTTVPDVTVRVITTNNIFLGDLFIRLQPDRSWIRPYLAGIVGFRYFFTETQIKNVWPADQDPIAETVNLGDVALAYGYGIGCSFTLWQGDRDRGDKEGPSGVQLEVGVRYMLGGEAEYMKKDSISRDSGVVTYDIVRSKTDLIHPFFGVRLVF